MFAAVPIHCPNCETKSLIGAAFAGRVAPCPGCEAKLQVQARLFKPDLGDVVHTAAVGLLMDLGGLLTEEECGEAFYRVLLVLRHALAAAEAKGREHARSA